MADPTVDPETGKRYDYYKILGLANGWTTEGEAKKAYYKAAMQHHPDKNRDSVEDQERSEVMFKYLQEAWKILSDPSERAYYDRHRSEILAGDVKDEFYGVDTFVNLQGFRTPSCYDKIDDSPRGFYTVYTGCFRALAEEEAKAAQIRIDKGSCSASDAELLGRRTDPSAYPPFGASAAAESLVSRFYTWWLAFGSVKEFAHEDVYSTSGNSKYRKLADKENEKFRREARNDFNARIRGFVQYVQRRDPRLEAFEAARRERDAERKRQQEAALERKRADRQQDRERARLEKGSLIDDLTRKLHGGTITPAEMQELERLAVVSPLQAEDVARQFDAELRSAREERRRLGSPSTDALDAAALVAEALADCSAELLAQGLSYDAVARRLFCTVCNQRFALEGEFKSHLSSKKHRNALRSGNAEDGASASATVSVSDSTQPSAPQSVRHADAPGGAKSRRKNARCKAGDTAGHTEAPQPTGEDHDKVEDEDDAPKRRRGAKQPLPQDGLHNCKVCGAAFESRTKLFNHIRDKGHAALKH